MNRPQIKPSAGPETPVRQVLLAVFLVALTLIVYIPAVRGGFFWDDYAFLTDTRLIQARDGLRRIWCSKEAPEYLPVTYTTHWVEWRLWGGHPEGRHAVNVLLHAAGAVLLWRVLRRLRLPGAWLAGLLFAVHPVAAASAGWIMERKNTLSMVFYLFSLLVFMKFEESAGGSEIGKLGDWEIGRLSNHPVSQSPNLPVSASLRLRVYFVSLFLFLLALLAKTSAVVLPLILLLCAWWRRGRITRKDLLRALPFFALSAALGLATIWFQWHGWGPPAGRPAVRPEGIASRAAAAGWIAWFCLFKLLLPVGLCAIYPRWNVDGSSAVAFLPLALLAAGLAFLWARRRTWGRAPLFAAAYFLVALLPVLGFVDMSLMQYTLAADHLQYAAMIGVLAFAAGILSPAATGVAGFGPPGWAGRAVAAGCVAVLCILTWGRASLYGEDQRFWRDNLAKNPGAWMAWNNLGWTVSRRNGPGEEPLRCFDRAIALNPKFATAYNNRAVARFDLGRYEEAVQDCDTAIRLDPDNAETYNTRANALAGMNRLEEALEDYKRAIARKPDYAEAYSSRGAARSLLGRYELALADCNEAITLQPDSFQAYNNRGVAWAGLNRLSEAIGDYSKAIELNPEYADAHYNRAAACLLLGDNRPALADCDAAIALKPDYADAYNNRAIAYYRLQEYDKALADLGRFEKLGGRPQAELRSALLRATGKSE